MEQKNESVKKESRTEIALKRAGVNIGNLFSPTRKAGGSYELQDARTIGFDLLRAYAYEIVDDVAQAVLERLKEFATNPDERDNFNNKLSEAIEEGLHEEVDSALIYTADQWAVAVGLEQSEFEEAESVFEGLTSDQWNTALGRYAYYGLLNAARRQLEVLRGGK